MLQELSVEITRAYICRIERKWYYLPPWLYSAVVLMHAREWGYCPRSSLPILPGMTPSVWVENVFFMVQVWRRCFMSSFLSRSILSGFGKSTIIWCWNSAAPSEKSCLDSLAKMKFSWNPQFCHNLVENYDNFCIIYKHRIWLIHSYLYQENYCHYSWEKSWFIHMKDKCNINWNEYRTKNVRRSLCTALV